MKRAWSNFKGPVRDFFFNLVMFSHLWRGSGPPNSTMDEFKIKLGASKVEELDRTQRICKEPSCHEPLAACELLISRHVYHKCFISDPWK